MTKKKAAPVDPASRDIALATLVEDFTLYPRNTIESTHINDLVRALEAGATLPPIIAEESSKRIVDGFHRRRAYLKHFGEDAAAPVEFRTYKTEADLFLDAVALNSSHGRRLDRHDQVRVVLRLRELGVDDDAISINLHVPPATIQQLSVRIIHGPDGVMPNKRGLEHLRGTTLSGAQVKAMNSVRSAEAGRLALELTRLLQTDLVDLGDAQIVQRLRDLQRALTDVLLTVAA